MPGPDQLHAPKTETGIGDHPALDLGPAVCADDVESRSHEWLLTNGRGGYACGSVANTLERRYHAMLAAAVIPPDTRTVVLAKFDERLVGFWDEHRERLTDRDPEDDPNAADCTLASDVWEAGGLSGFGHRHLIRCRLFEGRLEHTWLIGRTRLTRRLVMPHGHDVIVAEYRVDSTDRPVKIAVKAIGSNRPADFLDPGADWCPRILSGSEAERRLSLPGREENQELPVSIRVRGGHLHGGTDDAAFPWYRGYHLAAELRRGYDAIDDHVHLGECQATLSEGDTLRIEIAAADSADIDFRDRDPFAEEASRQSDLLLTAGADGKDENPLRRALISEADRFLVTRPIPSKEGTEPVQGASIIAGYPWFADWGRDTMIALPGLCLATGRSDLARDILGTFAEFEREGLLPNRFPGAGSQPEYNTVDAAFLFVEAVGRTWRATGGEEADAFLRHMLPTIDSILDAPLDGTLHGIRIDPDDGLITQGEDGLQLTWMDARIDGEVVTPRRGKAVEINGLLHSSLVWRSCFATHLGHPDRGAAERSARIRNAFDRFWLPDHGYLADVIDGPHGLDGSLRPNQLLATGCAHPPVIGERAGSVLNRCETSLLTPVGLRTLDPADTRYQPHYAGSQAARDAAYHMGTSWPWLLGPYLRTHRRVRGDADAIRGILAAFISEASRRCLGGIAEVHDGDVEHQAGGCLTQAWSVGEVLACMQLTEADPLVTDTVFD